MAKLSWLSLLVLLFQATSSLAETCLPSAAIVACTAPANEVSQYFRQCLKKELSALEGSPIAVALAYHVVLTVFDRQLQLQSRWTPAADHAASWEEFRARWLRRIAEHPQLAAYDQSGDLDPNFRGGLARRLDQITAISQRTSRTLRSPGAKFLMAAVYERVSRNDRNRLLSTFPELLGAPTEALINEFSQLITESFASLKKSLQNEKQPLDRDRKVATFVSAGLAQNQEVASRLVVAAEHLFRIQSLEVQNWIEADLDKYLNRPVKILDRPYLITLAHQEFGKVESETSNQVAAAQCQQFHRWKFWTNLEYVNDRYVGAALNYSMYPLLVGAVGSSLTRHWLQETNTIAPAVLQKAMPWIDKFVNIAGGATVLTGVPASLISLNQTHRREERAREVFYLSPMARAGSGATELDAYPDRKASAIINVGINFAFLVGGAVSILRH